MPVQHAGQTFTVSVKLIVKRVMEGEVMTVMNVSLEEGKILQTLPGAKRDFNLDGKPPYWLIVWRGLCFYVSTTVLWCKKCGEPATISMRKGDVYRCGCGRSLTAYHLED